MENAENSLHKIDDIEKLRLEYKEVISFISELNKNLTKDVIIPVKDNLAYFPGTIKKTNQSRIYLGENYYAETTNHRAIKLLSNRLEKLDVTTEKLKNQTLSNKPPVNDLFDDKFLIKEDDNTIEITEEINEQDYKKLKNKAKDRNFKEETIDISLQDKLKNIKQKREKTEATGENILIRKVRKVNNKDKEKDIIDLNQNTLKSKDSTTTENIPNKKSLFMQDEDV
jgi:prefoldin subunit 5